MYKVSEIAKNISGKVVGNSSGYVTRLSPFFQAEEDHLTFASDIKYIKKINETKAKVIIVPDSLKNLPEEKTYIKVNKNPREIMPILLKVFKKEILAMDKNIESNSKVGDNSKVSFNCYIGHNVIIGRNVTIYPGVVICQNVVIGDNCIIYPNVTIREDCVIGNNVIIQPNSVIGSDGFGFVKVDGNNIKIDQIGRVIIEDYVEIGANTTIDRGTIGDTVIKKYTKTDNQVHIAHNVIIGENGLLVAQVAIAGSTVIGNNVTIAAQSGITGHIHIGNNVVIGSKSGVTSNLEDNVVVSGFPVIDHKKELKIKVLMKKLPEILNRVRKIEKYLKSKENF